MAIVVTNWDYVWEEYMKRRRVVITGLGVVSPVGIGKEAFWESLAQGRSGIDRITAFDPADFSSQIAGEVKGFVPEDYISSRQVGRMSRFSQFAVAAAKMAVADAGLEIEPEAERIGVCFGTSIGGGGSVSEQAHIAFLSKGVEGVPSTTCLECAGHAPTSYVSIELGIKGSAVTVASGCATGLDVINWGHLEMSSGRAEVVVSGSTETPIYPFMFALFCAIDVLSKQNDNPKSASRPYDFLRDGLVLSEGAAAVVLEELQHAMDRGANIYAEVLGFGNASEATHMRKTDTEGTSLATAIEIALANGGLCKLDVDYINAHGNSMPDYDITETNAFKKVFGKQTYNIPISSIKSIMGQCYGASGTFQAVSSCLSIENSLIPPTINYEFPDPQCDLDYVPNKARSVRVDNVLMNAHSMGGMHSALILGKLNL